MKSIYLRASNDMDEEYEIAVLKYWPPSPQTRDDPGDGGDVALAPIVTRRVRDRKAEEIPFEEFLNRYAAHSGIDPARVEDVVRDIAMAFIAEELANEFEDSRESAMEEP